MRPLIRERPLTSKREEKWTTGVAATRDMTYMYIYIYKYLDIGKSRKTISKCITNILSNS